MIPPALIQRGAAIAEGAHVGSLVVVGEDVTSAPGRRERSVVLTGTAVGARSRCGTASSPPASRRRRNAITGGAVLGEGVSRGGNVITRGARVPRESLPDGAMKF